MTSSCSTGSENPDLRTVGPGQYDEIVSVWQRAGLPYKPVGRESRAEVERQMAMDPDMWLGCFSGGELVGVVVGSYDSRKGWLNRLAVVPECRGRGVGKALVAEMESRLRARGFRMIAALVNDDNAASLALFSESGYETLDHILYLRKMDDRDY